MVSMIKHLTSSGKLWKKKSFLYFKKLLLVLCMLVGIYGIYWSHYLIYCASFFFFFLISNEAFGFKIFFSEEQ